MLTICMYCGAIIKKGKAKPVSHGCCKDCFRVKGKDLGLSESQIEKVLIKASEV